MKRTKPLNHALLGAAAAAFVAAPASADINFFWTYSEVGGNVTNTLNLISDRDSFTAGLFADPDSGSFLNATGDLMPGSGTQSFFAGGPSDPIIVGTAPELGGADPNTNSASIGSVIDGAWISDWPGDVFPVGGINDPIFAGQFTIAAGTTGEYTLRISNAGDVENEIPPEVVQFSGTIVDGRFAQRLPGDANMDGSITLVDFGAWRNAFLTTPSEISVLTGDFNGDGGISLADFGIWRNGFLNPPPAAAPAALNAVPEPGSLVLLALSAGLLGRRRRRN